MRHLRNSITIVAKIKFVFQFLLVLLLVIPLDSCREKDDKDFIIDFFKYAQSGKSDNIDEYLSYTYEKKEKLIKEYNYLIKIMQIADLPERDSMKAIIDNNDFVTYEFTLNVNIEYMVGIEKSGTNCKIVLLSHMKKYIEF